MVTGPYFNAQPLGSSAETCSRCSHAQTHRRLCMEISCAHSIFEWRTCRRFRVGTSWYTHKCCTCHHAVIDCMHAVCVYAENVFVIYDPRQKVTLDGSPGLSKHRKFGTSLSKHCTSFCTRKCMFVFASALETYKYTHTHVNMKTNTYMRTHACT